jgi:large subunit ribosomal protein L18
MERLEHRRQNLVRRKNRIRSRTVGTAERPRLSVYVSQQHVTAQIIDDSRQQTLAYVTTVGQKQQAANLTERAVWVGQEIAKKAKAAKIKRIVFDRNGSLYHGRVKALADAAREGGMEF